VRVLNEAARNRRKRLFHIDTEAFTGRVEQAFGRHPPRDMIKTSHS
jgi:hypothetical protein